MKVSVYIATSLDGFIAREDGGLDWLLNRDERTGDADAAASAADEAAGEDFGYTAFMASVDALVMGRNTYALVQTFPAWPYGDTPVIVLSGTWSSLPADAPATVSLRAGTPQDLVDDLAAAGLSHIYLDGGQTIQGFLRAGLVDQLIITRIPVLIGQGIPLFGPLPHDVPLRHMETRTFPNGFVQSRYLVGK